jgi:hypothetical protein
LPAGARLVVLGDTADGTKGLWTLGPDGKWASVGATPGATAIGSGFGGIDLATAAGIDSRRPSDLAHSGQVTVLTWQGTAPNAPIVGLDSSAAGKLAVVAEGDTNIAYGLVGTDGAVTALAAAPVESFTAQVAWLDESRLLVLSTDNQQVSRLAIVHTGGQSMQSSQSLLGIRVFALSSDRRTVAATTESAVYAGMVADVEAGTPLRSIITLSPGQIVWAPVLVGDGSRLFMLSGTEAADGTVSSIRELGYARHASGWVETLDAAAPFGDAVGQVYLP